MVFHVSTVFPSYVGSICIYSTLNFKRLCLQPHIIWSSEIGNVRASAAVARERAMGLKTAYSLGTPVKSARNPKFWHDSLLKKGEK